MDNTSLHIVHDLQHTYEQRLIDLMAEAVVETIVNDEELKIKEEFTNQITI